jgi:hypothetical protein
MKNNLTAQLAAYGDQTRAERDTVTIADVLERGERVRPLPDLEQKHSSTSPRIVGVLVAASVLILAAVSLPILFTSVIQDVPPATPTSPTLLPAPTVVEDAAPVPSPSPTMPANDVEPGTPLVVPPLESVVPTGPITGLEWHQITPDGFDPTGTGITGLVSGGDRFFYIDGASRTVHSSFDGLKWTSALIDGSIGGMGGFVAWHDTVVGFGCGGASSSGGQIAPKAGCVSVIHPDGTASRRSFDGNIDDVGIGQSGIVVIVTNHHDDDGLSYASEDEVAWNLTGRDINEIDVFNVTDGVLHVEYDDQVADYVLSELGYAGFDEPSRSGWYSPDGVEWIPIPDLPAATSWRLLGTEDGFVGISGGLVWHSSNGLDWRELGGSPGFESLLGRWNGGALLAAETGNIRYASRLGIKDSPLATTGPVNSLESGSGSVGVVIVAVEGETLDLDQILYSPRGEEWITTSAPTEMLDLDLNISAWHFPVEATATDTNVILLLNQDIEGEDRTKLIWFLGTPISD